MKKSFMILAVLAMSALAMVSCKKDNENPIDDGTFGGGATEYPGLCFTAEKDTSSVSMNNCNLDRNFEYLIPGEDWTTFTPGSTTITLLKKGDKVYFRGDNANGLNDDNDNYYFVMTGEIAASGNIMSLIDTTCSATAIPNNYCFSNLFQSCKSLTSAPELPATSLMQGCYAMMFYGCKKLSSAPELPATTLAPLCYEGMFIGCNSLCSAPELPATTLEIGCYNYMFQNCINLNRIKVHFTDWNIIDSDEFSIPSYTFVWFANVPSGGTFYCPTALPKIYSSEIYLFHGCTIPNGWTVETF